MQKMTRTQKSTLAVVIITSFLGPFLISAVNIALPGIEQHYHMNAISLSWIMMSFLLSSAIFLLPAGRWADIRGVKKVFKLGTVLFTLFTFACALSPNATTLILFRFIQGIGAALIMTTGPAILISEFAPQQRGRVLGLTVAAVYFGLSAGPFVGGFITFYWNWQGIFYTSGLMGIFVMVVAYTFLGEDAALERKGTLDYWASLIYAIALGALVYGSSKIKTPVGQTLIAIGFVTLIFFLYLQSKSSNAIFPTKIFRTNRLFAFSNLAALINYSATFALVFLLSLYLHKIHHYSPRETGSILVAQPLVMALISPIAGRLSDKYEPRILASLGMLICTIGLALFIFLSPESSTISIVGILSFIGLGFGLFSSPNMNTIMSSVDRSKSGLASGTASTMRVLGQMVSMTIATALFAFFFENHSIETVSDELFIKGIRIAFFIFTLICAFGIYLSFSRGKMHQANEILNS